MEEGGGEEDEEEEDEDGGWWMDGGRKGEGSVVIIDTADETMMMESCTFALRHRKKDIYQRKREAGIKKERYVIYGRFSFLSLAL